MAAASLVFGPAPTVSLPVVGGAEGSEAQRYAVNRIFCVGRNYADNAKDMGVNSEREPPFFFMKPPTSLVDTGAIGRVHYPHMTQNLHHELGLVVAIGASGGHVTSPAATAMIYAVGVGIDLTRQDLQNEAERVKRPGDTSEGFDESAPIGPLVPVTALEASGLAPPGCSAQLANSLSLSMELRIGGQVQQHTSLDQMIWNCRELVCELSKLYDLVPGDLVFTGTPAGFSPLVIGDEVHATLSGSGRTWAECSFVVEEPTYHYRHEMVHGIVYPDLRESDMITRSMEEHVDWVRESVVLRSGDVVVATYPKCGTTVLEQIALLLLHDRDYASDPLSLNTFDRAQGKGKVWPIMNLRPHVSAPKLKGTGRTMRMPLDEFDALPGRRVLKSHDPVQLQFGRGTSGDSRLPKGVNVIVMQRNPYDVCVSMYYHAQRVFGYDGPFSAWQRLYRDGNVEFGSYFDWHFGWWDAKQKGSLGVDVLWLSYEDLLSDPLATVRAVATHLGVTVTDATVEWVARECSFKEMKNSAELRGKSKDKAFTKAEFYRKGEKGDWRTHFSAEDQETFAAVCKAKIKELGGADAYPAWHET